MGRDIGGHAHRNALAAVHQQVGEPSRKHLRLLLGGVKIVDEIDGLLVDAVQQPHSQFIKAALGVSHGRGRIVG